MKQLHIIIASALGAGYSPIAPGTVGAILACVCLWLFSFVDFLSTFSVFFISLIVLLTVLGVYSTNFLEKYWGKDPSKVVIDEVIGMFISMLFVPFSFLNVLLALGLFRFFDIAKPLGVKKLEALPKGIGVMADDVLAGIYANITLQFVLWLF